MSGDNSIPQQWEQASGRFFIAGAAALAVCVLGAVWNPTQFFRSYLLAYLFWLGIALGCSAIVMIHHLVGGGWGFLIRRLLEAGTRTLALMAVLFIPLLLGLSHVYRWAQSAAVAVDPALQYKAPYLNVKFFIVRAVIYFAIWITLAHYLNKWSFEQDRTGDPALIRRLEGLSAPGLILYGLTVTFASVDWTMSLEPEWTSTIYGMIFMMVEALGAMAFVIVMVLLLSKQRPLADLVSAQPLNDLGNLLLTFLMLWAYLSFAQFLIIWAGNLQEEIPWYLRRARGGWAWVAVILIVFHFTVPFFMLLFRGVKRRVNILARLAGALIFLSFVDLFWLVVPAFEEQGPRVHWMDLVAPIGIGAIWIGAFLRQLKGRPLVPLHDPRLAEAFGHAE